MQPSFDPTRKMTFKKNGRQPKKNFKKGRRPQTKTKTKWKRTSTV
jgi:hypothetical protein